MVSKGMEDGLRVAGLLLGVLLLLWKIKSY